MCLQNGHGFAWVATADFRSTAARATADRTPFQVLNDCYTGGGQDVPGIAPEGPWAYRLGHLLRSLARGRTSCVLCGFPGNCQKT